MTFLSSSRIINGTANVTTGLLAVFIVIQLLTAAGLVPVSSLWGGATSELTLGLRAASVGAAVLLAVFAIVIRFRAGLGRVRATSVGIRVLAWVVTAYLILNTLGNFASAGGTERFLFGPLTLVIAVASAIVAASRVRSTEQGVARSAAARSAAASPEGVSRAHS